MLGAADIGELGLGVCLCALLAAITVTDLDRRVIPNGLLLLGAGAGLAIAGLTDPAGLPERLLATGGAAGVLLAAALAHPLGMGLGDVKLAGVMGLYLGRAVVPALLVSFAAGAVAGLAIVARHGADARKRTIPFGPFLALGGIVALWLGEPVVEWYLGSLGP